MARAHKRPGRKFLPTSYGHRLLVKYQMHWLVCGGMSAGCSINLVLEYTEENVLTCFLLPQIACCAENTGMWWYV